MTTIRVSVTAFMTTCRYQSDTDTDEQSYVDDDEDDQSVSVSDGVRNDESAMDVDDVLDVDDDWELVDTR